MIDKNILIIGGYGTVGKTISKHLSIMYPNQIIVAGRNFEKAQELSKTLNYKAKPKQFDVLKDTNYSILKNVQLVIMCIDQVNTDFVSECIKRGIDYIDITAENSFFEKVLKLNNKAISNNTSILLSIGLAPGLTNLLAKNSMNKLDEIKNVDIYILLGLGEKHGDAAYKWTFNNIHNSYEILKNLKSKKIKSFSSPKKTNLEGNRTFYTFNFSDQHILIKDENIQENVITRFAFDSKFLTNSVGFLRKLGITRIFKNTKFQNLSLSIFKKINLGSDVFALKAVANQGDGFSYESTIKGNNQSNITAFMTVISAIKLLEKTDEIKGVNHIHEIISDIPEFLHQLKDFDQSIQIKL